MVDWVQLGKSTMQDARKAKGLSVESVSRLLPVSSKTYERYENDGRVPRHLLAKVADAIGLEIEEPERVRITVEGSDDETQEARFVRLEERFEGLDEKADRILALLEAQAEQGSG